MPLKQNLLMNFLRRSRKSGRIISPKLKIGDPCYDEDVLCDPKNREAIASNIKCRKGIGNIDKVLELSSAAQKNGEKSQLAKELNKIPNFTFPRVFQYGIEGEVKKKHEGYRAKHHIFKYKSFQDLSKSLKLLRMKNLGPITSDKSYILFGDVAQLEQALVQYALRKIMDYGFKLISVPDILPSRTIERCGIQEDGERTLIYSLDNFYGDQLSLSGTAEMSLATKLINSNIKVDHLPLKLAAVSRCFRAEISNSTGEQGIYRVHQFTKVEMFVCSNENESDEILNNLIEIQEELFSDLGLSFKIVDMPSHELGAPAYRKFDIEGWLPGKQAFGELSSCSNCTDYQSRRLNIQYETTEGHSKYVHTLNGTACAIPRTIIAICETYQNEDGTIDIPEKLVPFMNGKTVIGEQKVADMRDYKFKHK